MFKVGDRVECIENEDREHDLILGKVYIIDEIGYGDCYGFEGIFAHNHTSRFKLAEPQYTWTSKFNIGDKVVANDIGIVNKVKDLCISNEGIWYTLDCGVVTPEYQLTLYKEPKTYNMEFQDCTMEDIVDTINKHTNETIKIIKEG